MRWTADRNWGYTVTEERIRVSLWKGDILTYQKTQQISQKKKTKVKQKAKHNITKQNKECDLLSEKAVI